MLSLVQLTTFLGVVWDLTMMQACLLCILVFFLAIGRIKQGQAITVKFLGLMTAATNVIPFGLLYMKPLKRCLKTKGFPQEATNFA